ncbi:MAG: response regulator transcription factor [Anaerolineales bacterium]|nr:response regulator transcription factor [Anaerolineales bacterium]
MRVAILAPALALRVGLREVFRGLEDVEVIADASSLDEVPDADVLVLTSPDYLSDLDEDAPAVLLLTDDQNAAAQMMDLPVWGILSLDASPEELLAAVRALGEGLWTGSPALLQTLLERQPTMALDEGDPIIDPLTAREREVLQLAAEGLANKQIALALNISEHTVKFHLSSLYAKLGVTSRTEAVRAGARRGWVVL